MRKTIVEIIDDRIERALRGEDIGHTSGITYGQMISETAQAYSAELTNDMRALGLMPPEWKDAE